jgi:hypothetical protein
MQRPLSTMPTCGCLECGQPSPAGALRILVGVLTAPFGSGAKRRQAIRETWMHYSDVGQQLVVCFALGSQGLSRRARRKLDAPDVLWLETADAGILSMHKVFQWWRAAASGAASFTHAAKVDDDSYLHVPNLLNALSSLASVPHLVLGGLAHAGYNPQTFRMCGWQWQRGGAAWRARKCASRGFSEPFPFPLGALQVLSRSLFRAIGTAREIRAFAEAANASADLRKRESNEDVALGFWVATLAKQGRLNVTFHGVNARATNLGCFRNAGLYRNPSADALVIHRVKGHNGMPFLWRVLHDGVPFDVIDCAREAAIEIPKNALVFDPAFEKKVREGRASVKFDQQTNRLLMTFATPRPQAPLANGTHPARVGASSAPLRRRRISHHRRVAG